MPNKDFTWPEWKWPKTWKWQWNCCKNKSNNIDEEKKTCCKSKWHEKGSCCSNQEWYHWCCRDM